MMMNELDDLNDGDAGKPLRTIGGAAGTPDVETLQRRAHELARIDGRIEPNERDFAQAAEELRTTGSIVEAPESGASLDKLTTWDTPLDASGHQSTEAGPDDESVIGEKLVEEGIEEAEHDRRVSASEETDDEDAER
ncbi:MAG TPA: hypothetical protein VFV83_04065 [Chthoniobacteraceae bacterium]|nr:hypothetical protein [Chthoniobacteraceae bacterium]